MQQNNEKYFGIFNKFLISFLLVSVVPLIIYGLISIYSIQSIGNNIVEEAFLMADRKTQEDLKLQALLIAKHTQNFLNERENELLTLSKQNITPNLLLSFYKTFQKKVWVRTENNFIEGEKYFIPLYKEIQYINNDGKIILEVSDGKIQPNKVGLDVSNPRNTRYKSEEYFNKTINLGKNEIYVSHLNGFYVSKKEQLYGIESLDSFANQIIYDGVIRFSTPVFDGMKRKGILVIGLDHRHLMELTQHVLPNSNNEVLYPSYQSGDYAFMFDDEGWIITHPKLWDIRGVDDDGKIVPPYTEQTSKKLLDEGKIPFNLNYARFIHENYPKVAQSILNKNTGSVVTTNVGGIKKIMAFAPIIYNKGVYTKSGVFGGITIGAEITKFNLPSIQIKNKIASGLQFLIKNSFLFILATFVLVVFSAWFISKHFTNPIIKLTNFSKNLAEGELDQYITPTRNDELGILANSFNRMSLEIKKGRDRLLSSYRELEKSKSDIQKHALNLEYQLKILKSIQSIGNLLGATFELNDILKYILKTCVETLKFDRAILYLVDEDNKYLECKEIYGFDETSASKAVNSKYNLQRYDCIETRIIKTGKPIFVDDFQCYKDATELDKKIRNIAKSNSFVFLPLRVKENNIGVLGVDKILSKERITETDINSLQILANQASRVIENTKLYNEVIAQRNFVNDIISNMINGVVSTDGKGIIKLINKAAVEIFNFSSGNLIGENIWQLLKDVENFKHEMRQNLENTGVYRGYNVKVMINNEIKNLNINASRVYNNGIHTNSIIIVQDLTEKMKLDEEIQNIERLASIGRFAAGIAHEIRNPLTGISLFLDNLHDSLEFDNDKQSPLLKTALAEIERLDNLISQILQYAVPSKGVTKKEDINKVINETLILIKSQTDKNGIDLNLELSKEPQNILMNPERIKQALLNLIINSIQYTPEGGTITVSTQKYGDNQVIIKIKDNGPGINPNDLPHIFDPFYSKKDGGTGLGLSITHSIITDHLGSISAENGIDAGAVFKIILPITT